MWCRCVCACIWPDFYFLSIGGKSMNNFVIQNIIWVASINFVVVAVLFYNVKSGFRLHFPCVGEKKSVRTTNLRFIDRFEFCEHFFAYRRFVSFLFLLWSVCICNQIDIFDLLLVCAYDFNESHAINILNGCISAINIRFIFRYHSFIFARQCILYANPFDTNDTRIRRQEEKSKNARLTEWKENEFSIMIELRWIYSSVSCLIYLAFIILPCIALNIKSKWFFFRSFVRSLFHLPRTKRPTARQHCICF